MPNTLEDFAVGQRVQVHPACDLWMRGARYGTVEKVGRQYIHVHIDRSGFNGTTYSIAPHNLLAVTED
jgi:hypothetical protein